MKIKCGAVYSVDPSNINKQKVTGLNHVIVEKLEKYRPFGNSLYKCLDFSGVIKEPILLRKYMLKPSHKIVIRIDSSIPSINENDIEILEKLIEDYHFTLGDNINKIQALITKLKFYNEMRDV